MEQQSPQAAPSGSLSIGRAGLFTTLLSSKLIHIAFLIAALGVTVALIVQFELRVVGKIGFAMDDAWIHTAIARNFIEGHGYGIVPGRPLPVSTSPTWTLAVALFLLIFGDPITATLVLSILCMAGALVLSYFVIRALTGIPILAVVGTMVFLTHPVVLWGILSGMELPLVLLALLLFIASYYLYEPDSAMRRYGAPIALGIAAVTRPEIFVLIPLAILDTFVTIWRSGKNGCRKRAIVTAVMQGLLVCAVVSPYFIFNKINGGLMFPTTYYAKTRVRGVGIGAALRAHDWEAVWRSFSKDSVSQALDIARNFFEDNVMGFLLLVIGSLGFTRAFSNRGTARGILLPVTFFVLPWIMGLTSPTRFLSNHADRYYVVFAPLFAMIACVGIWMIWHHARQSLIAAFCALCLMLAPFHTTYRAVQLLATDVDSTERLYHDMGDWLAQNLDPKAVLAVNDIGGIAYFAPRNLIDIMGLASPEIWPAIERAPRQKQDVVPLRAYLQDKKVEYVILCPCYHPTLTGDSKTFQPIKEWAEKYPHGRQISPQVLYKVNWE